MSTQVILLQRVENLGDMGEVVNVKPGYARNYLLPQNKALRATKTNIAYFEGQKAALEKANANKRKDAEAQAKKVDGVTVVLIRQASEAGQLFGSVSSRDIAEAVATKTGEKVDRTMVNMNTALKTLGLFPIELFLHPEVKVKVTINIARSQDEAQLQEKTGKAVVAAAEKAAKDADEQAAKAAMLEDSALEAEAADAQEEASAAAEKAAKAEAKAAKKASKKPDDAEEEVSAE
jgi:large subunit ribosomal protein L9